MLDLYEFNDTTALIRLLMALVASGILGMERTRKLRPAGMRTYMLVCSGACSTVLAGLSLFEAYGPGFDPARMSSQVISGIGFIGAGTIMVTPRQKVRGLTTAAGLWAVACLGINIGVGNYAVSLGVFLAMLITMLMADKLELVFYRHLKRIHVTSFITSMSILQLHDFLQQLLAPYLEKHLDSVVLGCTHYPFARKMIRRIVGDSVTIFDGGEGTAREMRRRLAAADLLNPATEPGWVRFENSVSTEAELQLCRRLLKQEI